MVSAPEYSVKTQAKLVHALCVLHNVIRIHNPDDFDSTIKDELARIALALNAADFGWTISNEEQREATSH